MIDKHLLMEKLQIATANTVSPIVAHGLIKAQEIVLNMKDEDPAVEPTKCIAQLKIDTDELIERIKGSHIIEPKWIPCSERLPEEEGNYLVTFGAFAETINGEKVIFGDIDGSVSEIGYGCYERDIFWHPTAFGWYDLATATPFDKRAIIAWMPLPEPYSGEANEKVEGSER